MYDGGKIIAGLIIGVGLLAFPFWPSAGKYTAKAPEPQLTEKAKEVLGRAVDFLRQNQQYQVEIQGHTDSTGSEAYNLRLGERRAEAVRAYLNAEHQIPLHRMSVISYGESDPVADNSTQEGRTANRRVEIVCDQRTAQVVDHHLGIREGADQRLESRRVARLEVQLHGQARVAGRLPDFR